MHNQDNFNQSNTGTNPYSTPQSNLHETASAGNEFDLLAEPRKLAAGAGWQWITDAWSFFKAQPGMWILFLILYVVVTMAASFIPLGSVLILPFLTAGIMIGCDAMARGYGLEISHLFAGFQQNFVQLLLVGLLYFIFILLAIIPGAVIVGVGLMGSLEGGALGDAASFNADMFGITALLGALVMLALVVPVLMLYFFAPALVVFHDMPAFAAMKLSFKACWRNVIPFLVCGVMAIILSIIAVIPLGLGLLVLSPVLMIATYTSYRAILTVDEG